MAYSIREFLSIMRLHQYIKNLFIFSPLFFASKITDIELLFHASIAFISFSLTSSAIYIFNDLCDIEEDRQHPIKSKRPLASGMVSKPQAYFMMAILMFSGVILMLILPWNAVGVLVVYVVINIGYSLHWKHIAIFDVTIIAIGFVLRLLIGSAGTGIILSMWIVIVTFLLALFIALAKRRDDVLIYLNTGIKARKAIDGYNLQFLDTTLAIMAAVVIVAYTIYTTSDEVVERVHSGYLYLTSLFVILGILRYLQIIFVHLDSGSPTNIVCKDRFLQLVLCCWIIVFGWMLY